MTRTKHIIWLLAILLTACKADFDPMLDSSVRTVCVQLDCRTVLDSFLVKQGNQFLLGYMGDISQNMRLRLTVYCYDSEEQLFSTQTQIESSLEVTQVYISHLDTLQEYSICCVADFITLDSDPSYHSSWVQMTPNQRSSLYMFYSAIGESVANHVSVAKWSGRPTETIGPLTFQPAIYNGYVRLTNYGSCNTIWLRWNQCASTHVWDATPASEYRYAYTTKFYPEILAQDTCIPLYMAHCNDSISLLLKTRIGSKQDSVVYRIGGNKRPFLITMDCAQLEIKDIQMY